MAKRGHDVANVTEDEFDPPTRSAKRVKQDYSDVIIQNGRVGRKKPSSSYVGKGFTGSNVFGYTQSKPNEADCASTISDTSEGSYDSTATLSEYDAEDNTANTIYSDSSPGVEKVRFASLIETTSPSHTEIGSITEEEREVFDTWLCADLDTTEAEATQNKEKAFEELIYAPIYTGPTTGPHAELIHAFKHTLGFLPGFGLEEIGNHIVDKFSVRGREIAFCLEVVDTDPASRPFPPLMSDWLPKESGRLVTNELIGALQYHLTGEDVRMSLGLTRVGMSAIGTFGVGGKMLSYCLQVEG